MFTSHSVLTNASKYCHSKNFVPCRQNADVNTLYARDEKSVSLVKGGLDRAWMERALFSMSPMFCSACACLACHPLPSQSLTLFTSFLSIFHNYLCPIPHTSLPYPAPPYVDGDSEIGLLSVCVCVCEECRPTQPLAPPGDRRGDWILGLESDGAKQMKFTFSCDGKKVCCKNQCKYWKLRTK